jgi:hypothetical protein
MQYPPKKPKGYGACPSFFCGVCRSASAGGTNGYQDAGYTLASHLSDLAPFDVEEDAWYKLLEQLASAVETEDNQATIAWLDRWVPRCLALVPTRRRESFLKGLYRYQNDDSNDIALRW